MARRGIHNDLAEKLMTRLEDKIEMDLTTARRFITLISSLFISAIDQRTSGGVYG